jgi:signal transduction histidine kinase
MDELISEQAARELFDRARAIHAFRVRADGTVQSCNGAALENLGVSREAIVGQPLGRFLTEPDGRRLEAELVVGGRRPEPILLNFSNAQHLPYTLECWFDVEPGAGATIVGEPPLQRDQRAQRQLIQANEALAVLSREKEKLVESERRARLDAEEADRQKDRLLAVVSHELRQPLGPLRFAMEILSRDGSATARERARAAMLRQLTHLSRLVDDLLDAARIRQNKLSVNRERIDLSPLLRDLADEARQKAVALGVDFRSVLPEAPVWLSADGRRMRQVFSNLLDNAFKYTSAGGRIELVLSVEGNAASVTVRDNGRGIPPEVAPRLFKLFSQAAEGERGGLGIGLALAATIVSMHGGQIEAHSEGAGRGSEFVVRLPRDDEASSAHCGTG